MIITTKQLAALLEGVRRYSEDEISFYELKDLINEVEAAKPLFKDQKPHLLTCGYSNGNVDLNCKCPR